jgi:glutathione peroxidase
VPQPPRSLGPGANETGNFPLIRWRMSFRRTIIRHDILIGERLSRMQQGTGSVYEFSAHLLDGRTVRLDEFQGRVLLIVNTASQCGFTPQYTGLEELYRANRERGFEVLGFPCNQFGSQEPGTAEEIGAFCERNYGVSFPLFAKIDVNGPSTHPLYRFLKESRPGLLGTKRIKWNFTKFLVDRQGRAVSRFAPASKPKDLAGRIDSLLGK